MFEMNVTVWSRVTATSRLGVVALSPRGLGSVMTDMPDA